MVGGDWNPQGAPKWSPKGPQGSQNAAQEKPKTGKMETKGSPELPEPQKRSPREPLNSQNEQRGIQGPWDLKF